MTYTQALILARVAFSGHPGGADDDFLGWLVWNATAFPFARPLARPGEAVRTIRRQLRVARRTTEKRT